MLISGCVIAITVVFITLVARRSLREAFSEGVESLRRDTSSAVRSLLSPVSNTSSIDVNAEDDAMGTSSRTESSVLDVEEDDEVALLSSPNRLGSPGGEVLVNGLGLDEQEAERDESKKRGATFTRKEQFTLYGTFIAAVSGCLMVSWVSLQQTLVLFNIGSCTDYWRTTHSYLCFPRFLIP